jgi:hypothetical protein
VCCIYSLVSGFSKWLPKWYFTSLDSTKILERSFSAAVNSITPASGYSLWIKFSTRSASSTSFRSPPLCRHLLSLKSDGSPVSIVSRRTHSRNIERVTPGCCCGCRTRAGQNYQAQQRQTHPWTPLALTLIHTCRSTRPRRIHPIEDRVEVGAAP